jgi:hypothetical protein
VTPINMMASCGSVQVASDRKIGCHLRTCKGHVGPLKAGNCLSADTGRTPARGGTRVLSGLYCSLLVTSL